MFGKKRKSLPRRQLADQNSKRVYSYYSNTRLRSEEQPDRSRQASQRDKKPPSTWWRHIPTYMALAGILVCLGYILGVNTNPKIVQAEGNQSIFLRDKNTYQQAANKIINKSIQNLNKVTFNVNGVAEELKREFPELSEVTISLPIINRRPVIYVTSSRPALVLVTEDRSVVIDDRGVAVLPASQVPNLTKYNLPTVRDKSGLSPEVGKPVLPGTDVKFILDIYKQFKIAKQPVDQLTLPAIANELDVKLRGHKYHIKMDLLGDSREETGAFLAAQPKINNLQSSLTYIDVRVPGRVYYK